MSAINAIQPALPATDRAQMNAHSACNHENYLITHDNASYSSKKSFLIKEMSAYASVRPVTTLFTAKTAKPVSRSLKIRIVWSTRDEPVILGLKRHTISKTVSIMIIHQIQKSGCHY